MADKLLPEVKKHRKPGFKIQPFILNRWSPRSMTGEGMSDKELLPLFEAARWAPSSYNGQPWRFLYAKRDTKYWDTFFNLLVPANQAWAKYAACLVVVISKKTFEHNQKPSHTHSFDTGAAWISLAFEAVARKYAVHGMEGFDYEEARKKLRIPEDYQIEAMIAIGKRAPAKHLPEALQKKEFPNQRRPLSEIIREGRF
jgi:nitroreductase